MPTPPTPKKQPLVRIGDSDLIGPVYSVIAARRTAFDTLMWQVPALGLAAQAFLLTIAYGSDSSRVARYISGFLSLIVALVAIQTMLKHRANEKTDSLILSEIELANGIELQDVTPHDPPTARGVAIENDLIGGFWVKRRSAYLWIASLTCFAIAGMIAIALAMIDPSTLSQSTPEIPSGSEPSGKP